MSYKLKDLGEAKLVLGMHIERNPISGDIILLQKAYCEQMLKCFSMQNYSPKSTPLPPGLILSSDNCPNTPKEHEKMKKTSYWEALGSLMWLQVITQPDLSYAVGLLSCFAHNPGKTH